MTFIKHLESFFYPIVIEKREGTINPYLEVIKYNGKYILNNENANLSYGGLHKIFEQLFELINFNQYEFKNVLILGMGAGDLISLLKNKYKNAGYITTIEKDKVVIELAEKYFNINEFHLLNIINADAFEYVRTTNEKYDLIISDLLIDTDVPEIFASNEYLMNIQRISTEKCCIIYNKITQKTTHKLESIALFKEFESIFKGAQIHQIYANEVENSLLYYNTLTLSKNRFAYINKSSILQLITE